MQTPPSMPDCYRELARRSEAERERIFMSLIEHDDEHGRYRIDVPMVVASPGTKANVVLSVGDTQRVVRVPEYGKRSQYVVANRVVTVVRHPWHTILRARLARLVRWVALATAVAVGVLLMGCAARPSQPDPVDLRDLVEAQRMAIERTNEAESLDDAKASNLEAMRLGSIIAERVASIMASAGFLYDVTHHGE